MFSRTTWSAVVPGFINLYTRAEYTTSGVLTMDFVVPDEYKQFVSSTEELLNQFGQAPTASGIISYCIYFNGQFVDALTLRRNIMEIVEPLSSGYLWHNEHFNLIVQAEVTSRTVLRGSTRIGDCIDDEWFIVYLLLIVSKAIPEIAISVDDADGEFLLMEGADHIPDWLGPENAENRVWICGGNFHIIPIDEPGKSKSGGMILEKALKCIMAQHGHNNSSLACTAFHQTIFGRTTNVFPAKMKANDHLALCILPDWLAKLLEGDPDLVARAVDAFHNTDQEVLRKYCAASKGPTSQRTTAVTDQLRAVTVRMTRVMYAQLTFKNFRPPRKYHGLVRRVALASSRKVSQAFDVGCRLACGLECAYQLSIEQMKDRSIGCAVDFDSSFQGAPQWSELLRVAEKDGYPLQDPLALEELKSLFQQNLIMSTANFDIYTRRDGAYPQGFHRFVDSRLAQLKEVGEPDGAAEGTTGGANEVEADGDLERADRAVFCSVMEGVVRGDEDAWLYMSPEELDQEMEARVRNFGASGTYSTDNTAITATSVEEATVAAAGVSNPTVTEKSEEAEQQAAAKNLQSMVDGIKSFLDNSSGIDGVASSRKKAPMSKVAGPAGSVSSKADIAQSAENASTVADLASALSTGLSLDLGYLDKLLKGPHCAPTTEAAATTTTHSTAPAPSTTTDECCGGKGQESIFPAAEEEAADLAGYFSQADLEEFDGSGSDDDDDSDLDEEDDQQGARAADSFLESVFSSNSNGNSHSNNNGHSGAPSQAARKIPPQQQQQRESEGKGEGKGESDHGPRSSDRQHAARGGVVLGTGTGFVSSTFSHTLASASSSRREAAVDAVDSDDELDAAVAKTGAQYDNANGETESVGSDDSQEQGLDEQSIREFQKMMDLELFGESSLSETFEWAQRDGGDTSVEGEDGDRDVDVDLTLLKNLMEAQTQGMGSPLAGPLGQLMAQLGINMPTPPPMKNRPK